MPESSENTERLPEAVLRLAKRLGCMAGETRRQVEFRQVGQMRQDQASVWMSFTARQRIALAECAFEWKARTGPIGLAHVRDAFDGSHGSLSVSLLGVAPIVRAPHSTELDRGELMRYLAEIPWAPDAILLNAKLHWRVLDDTHLIVTTGRRDHPAEVTFTLNSSGYIIEAFAKDRPRLVGKNFVLSAWRGVFSDYRRCEGRLLPHSAEVSWVYEGGCEPVWRGHIVKWRAVSERDYNRLR